MQLQRCGRSTESIEINNNKTMSDFPKDAPNIKDAKPRKKTNVKNYPGLGYAPTIKEGRKPKPLGAMVGKAYELDARAQKEKSISKKQKLEDRARLIQMAAYEQLDDLLTDPLEELYELAEAMLNVQEKPPLQNDEAPHHESPHKGQFEHPVTKQRNEVDSLIAQGMEPTKAHMSVHGDVDTADTQKKGALAGTLGRIQDNDLRRGVKIEDDKNSILARDARLEKQQDAVTFDDLRTPMNQQVPDDEQQPSQGGVKEELNLSEEYDYNLDVAYLQQFGRA